MKRFLSKWLSQKKSGSIEGYNRIEPKITNNIGNRNSYKHTDITQHPDELFLDFDAPEEVTSTETSSELSKIIKSEQLHDNEFDGFGDLRKHQNNKAPYVNEFGGFEDLGEPKKRKIEASIAIEQTGETASEITIKEKNENKSEELVDHDDPEFKKPSAICKNCKSSLIGIFSSIPLDVCPNCGKLAEASSEKSKAQLSTGNLNEGHGFNWPNNDEENFDSINSREITTKLKKQTVTVDAQAAYKPLPDLSEIQTQTEQSSKTETNNHDDTPVEDLYDQEIAKELISTKEDQETYPNYDETFSQDTEYEADLSNPITTDDEVDAEFEIGNNLDEFDDYSKYKNSDEDSLNDNHENNTFSEYLNDVEDWEIYLDEDLEEQRPGYQEYFEDEDPLETENIIGYATRLTVSSNLPRVSERKDALGFYIGVLGDFPYYQSYAAIERLLERGSSIHHIADVYKVKYLWATNPFLWANRRFDKLERGWKVNSNPLARNSMSWQMASDLVKNFSFVELENLILVDWYKDWLDLELIDYNSASGLAPAYGMYSSYLSEMRNKHHSMVNRW